MNLETKAAIGEWGMKILKWVLPAFVIAVLLALFLTPSRVLVTDAKTHLTRYLILGLRVGMESYKQEYGNWPEGAAMYIQLEGKNAKSIVFHEPRPSFRLSDGSMIDAWKHGIIFDGIIDDQPRFHSIGKDGIDQHGAEGSDDIVSWQ